MSETTQEERDHMRNFTGDSPEAMIHHKLVRDADRLARLEDGIRAMADVTDFGDDSEEMVHCNWVRDRLNALLDGE